MTVEQKLKEAIELLEYTRDSLYYFMEISERSDNPEYRDQVWSIDKFIEETKYFYSIK